MSFGRSMMNVCTLGLWGVLVDPDFDDVFVRYDVFVQVTAYKEYEAATKLAGELVKKFSWIKGLDKSSDRAEFFQGVASVKEGDKLAEFLQKEEQRFKQSGVEVRMSFFDTGYWLPKGHDRCNGGLHIIDDFMFCPKCPRLLVWGHRKITCSKGHSKTKGVHADTPDTKPMEYESVTMSRYGLDIWRSTGIEIDEDEDD